MKYTSSDFQCPVTGVPVVLIWNEDTYEVAAKWCQRFCGFAASLEEANDIAEKYDCWF